jgi:hypothetical protein
MNKMMAGFFLIFIFLSGQAIAKEEGTYTAQHDITLLEAPETLVETNGVLIQKLRAMIHFFGDLVCTAETEIILVSHPSGDQEISGTTTYPMPDSGETCELLGISFSGQGRSRAKGSFGLLEGSFQIQGRTGNSDKVDLHIRGETVTDLSAFPPVQMEGTFSLTP